MLLRRFTMQSRNSVIAKPKTFAGDYETAIEALNNLQSNADYLRQIRNKDCYEATAYENTILKVQKYLERIGITLEKLDKLSVIHVAGTKGKGSTCAFCESILRQHGYKTGFFSSPHLVSVRERIRINGVPLGRKTFANYFWNVYESLDKQKSNSEDMPLYFRFLTLMAFKVFLDEEVDVAVVEVGIGGKYDCTNVLRKVPVVGITSIGLDHTNILGNTIDSIAKNKSGIMKPGSQVFTVSQPNVAMKVLNAKSIETNCVLKVVDDSLPLKVSNKTIPDDVLSRNASLAVAMCEAWMVKCTNQKLSPLSVKKGLNGCIWLGRYQVIHRNNVNYYLDGAHTEESIDICVKWFKNMTKNSANKKTLIFNATGDRNSENLLSELKSCEFDKVFFTPNVAIQNFTADTVNYNITVGQQFLRCEKHKLLWTQMEENNNEDVKVKKVLVLPSVLDALEHLNDGEKYDCLITGSLHLVGAALSLINPDLNQNGENN